MSTLIEHIKAHPEKSISQWAREFGISRPFLYGLLDGSREPSLEVAESIRSATAGRVPVASWPNHGAVVASVKSDIKEAQQ